MERPFFAHLCLPSVSSQARLCKQPYMGVSLAFKKEACLRLLTDQFAILLKNPDINLVDNNLVDAKERVG